MSIWLLNFIPFYYPMSWFKLWLTLIKERHWLKWHVFCMLQIHYCFLTILTHIYTHEYWKILGLTKTHSQNFLEIYCFFQFWRMGLAENFLPSFVYKQKIIWLDSWANLHAFYLLQNSSSGLHNLYLRSMCWSGTAFE